MLTGIILNTFIMLITFIPAFFMQKFSQRAVFYGVRIPLDFENNEELMKENKRYKKQLGLVFALVYLICIILTVVIKETYHPIILMVGIFVDIFGIQWCYYIANKRVKEIKKKNNWRDLLTQEDDNYYIWGMFYYNPNDPALWVEKRAGVGWTINIARPFGKVFMAIIGLILVGCLVMVIYASTSMKVNLDVTSDGINIKGMYSENIKKDEIKDITFENGLPAIANKQNGGAIGNKKLGYFKTKTGEKVKLFIEDDRKPVVKVVTGEKTMYINYEDDIKTKELYEKIKK